MPGNEQFLLTQFWMRTIFFSIVAYYIGVYGYVWYMHQGILSPSMTSPDGVFSIGGEGTLGRDFINYYSGAKIAISEDPLILFDKHMYWAMLRYYYGETVVFHNWSYPPHTLLFIWPLALFPYLVSFALWTLSGLGSLYYAMRKLTINKYDALALLLTPTIFLCIYTGQNGMFTTTLILLTFAFLKKKPVLAGVVLACLTIKPQLGILFPIILLLMREWQTILSASVTTIVLILASTLIFGVDAWQSYLHTTLPLQKEILANAQIPFTYMVPSMFMAFKNMGFSDSAAMVAQSFTTIPAIIAVIWGFMKKRPYELQIPLFIICTLMLSPYVVNYDMVMLLPAAYFYYVHIRKTNAANPIAHFCFALFIAMLPELGQIATSKGFQIYPFAMIAFFVAVLVQLRKATVEAYPPIQLPHKRRTGMLAYD